MQEAKNRGQEDLEFGDTIWTQDAATQQLQFGFGQSREIKGAWRNQDSRVLIGAKP